MYPVQQTIRILVIILIIENGRCQDAYSDRDMLRYQQMASNQGQVEAITGYSTNIIQRDPNGQSISSVSVQYHMADEASKNDDYNRADRARSRKVYRIKNPFQQQSDDTDRQPDSNSETQDSGMGASNQYAAMQYSLPPEEFLQQMRSQSQYYQQQPQVSTPTPSLGYTATPQPQYQYSTISASYDNSQQSNQISQIDPKTTNNQYFPNSNPYQFNTPNAFSFDSVQSTPSPVTSYLSTSLPNSQFVGTPTNPYVSSSSPIFLSSPPNLQQYVSSPLAVLQTGAPDFSNNRGTTTIGSNSMSYDNNDLNKKIQIDHYDNSANGIRYPNNVQQQYQNEYASSTPTPPSSSYPDPARDSWQNSMNAGVNALSKSLQELSLTQYQNYPYNNQHESRPDSHSDNGNNDIHRIGNMPSANNVYLNFVQPDYQTLSKIKSQTRDLEQETGQSEFYSNGDYGWKLAGKKPLPNNDVYSSGNFQRYQQFGSQSDGNGAISQMNFHMDTSKPYMTKYDQASKSSSDNEAQEFAKAAAKAHENLKQQQNLFGNTYSTSPNGNNPSAMTNGNMHYGNNDKQKNKYTDTSNSNIYAYSSSHPDLVTASPYYFASTRENLVDNKAKPTFDHAKALKNIVPIDVSNVVSNSDSQMKTTAGLEGSNRYNIQNYGKDHIDQNRQYYQSLADSYYKDKNAAYGLNIKTKPEEYLSSESPKQFDPNASYYGFSLKQQQPQEQSYNQASFSGTSQSYKPQISGNYYDSIQSSANIQQQDLQRPVNQMSSDFTSILKLNDVPYRLTQGLSSDSLRFHNNNLEQSVSSPLPMRINQNVGSHQIDVTSNIFNKLMANNQPGLNINRPETESQAGGLTSTINGFRVANPYNVDLKLFAEMLKGKPAVDDTHMVSLRDQYNKPAPLKLDLSQLQFLLKNENTGNLAPLNDGFSALSSPYLAIYNTGRFPYEGVKYSRSQEEEESIPIADSSNNHPIGAVMEQDDPANEASTGSDVTAQGDESISSSFDSERPKETFITSNHRAVGDRHRHPNSLLSGRYTYQRKYPKSDIQEPYPLLKPPPPNTIRGRGSHIKIDRHGRRRRINKPRLYRIMKTEPMFEADTDEDNFKTVPTLLRPPPPVVEEKSDRVDNESNA